MKKFTINCDFGGQMSPFTIFIGEPESEHHPLHFQADWLSKERNGTIPSQVMDAIAKLKELASKNNVSLEELCVYALGSVGNDELRTAASAERGETIEKQEESLPNGSTEQMSSTETAQTQESEDNIRVQEEKVDNQVVDEIAIQANPVSEEQVMVTDNIVPERQNFVNIEQDEEPADKTNEQEVVTVDLEKKQ